MIELGNSSLSPTCCDSTWIRPDKAYRCHIASLREDDGTFSVIVLNLPGCGSCGATEEDAIENVREAVLGVVESHLAAGEAIPWRDSASSEIPQGANPKWILVNA